MTCSNLCNLLAMAKKLLPDDASGKYTCPPCTRYKSDSTFFHSPKHRRDFAVHPDWVSERLQPKTDQPYPLSVHTKAVVVNPAARGRSTSRRAATANAAAHRDPITWRDDWPRRSKVVLNAAKVEPTNKTRLPFDFGCHDKSHRKRSIYEGTCFARNSSQPRPDFTIHPEWVSESLSVKGMGLCNKRNTTVTQLVPPPRRCKSAPPPRTRNPITWENC